jgi:hypothetical protein
MKEQLNFSSFSHKRLKNKNDLGFLGFQAAMSYVVLEEAEGSPIKQKLRRCRKGFG